MPRGRAMSQVEVEEGLLEEIGHLEALTNGGASPKTGDDLQGYDETCRLAAEAEADWKIEEAKGLIHQANQPPGEGKTRGEGEYMRRARVLATKPDLYRAYKVRGAAKDGHKEALVTSRARADALRTIAANIRTQT